MTYNEVQHKLAVLMIDILVLGAVGLGLLGLILGLTWLLTPYRSWKDNFRTRIASELIKVVSHAQPRVEMGLQEYRIKVTEKSMKSIGSSKYPYQLTLVVPSYNQQARLPIMLEDVASVILPAKISTQIIIVNDGSRDRTTEVALAKGKQLKLDLVVVEYPKNRGKGGAVRAGVAVAQGQYVLMVDADGATTFSELHPVMARMKELQFNPQKPLAMVVGSRRHLESENKVERKWHRKLVSGIFRMIIGVVLGIQTKDTQCGFKLFTAETAQLLFKIMHIERFAFDVELFFLCRQFQVQTDEVAVEWRDVDGSKLSVLDASANMLRDVLVIRLYYLLRLWRYSDRVEVQ